MSANTRLFFDVFERFHTLQGHYLGNRVAGKSRMDCGAYYQARGRFDGLHSMTRRFSRCGCCDVTLVIKEPQVTTRRPTTTMTMATWNGGHHDGRASSNREFWRRLLM